MKSFLLSLMSLAAIPVFAQDSIVPPPVKNWKREIQAGVYLNQSSFSNNWKGGGVNTIAWNGLLNAKTLYTKGRFEWSNDLQTKYGNVHTKDQGTRKNFDRIFFESKVSHKISGPWRAFGSVNFLSQFDKGYDYKKDVTGADSITLISSFMSPGYLTEALGLEFKPVDYFSAELGVGAMRQTFVLNQDLYTASNATLLYGVEKGKNVRNQFVLQFVLNFDKEIVKNIFFKARYMAVVDYEKINGQGIVHRLDANLVAKVNKYVNVNIGTVVLYDHDQDPGVQYSQALGIGILYTFSEFEQK